MAALRERKNGANGGRRGCEFWRRDAETRGEDTEKAESLAKFAKARQGRSMECGATERLWKNVAALGERKNGANGRLKGINIEIQEGRSVAKNAAPFLVLLGCWVLGMLALPRRRLARVRAVITSH